MAHFLAGSRSVLRAFVFKGILFTWSLVPSASNRVPPGHCPKWGAQVVSTLRIGQKLTLRTTTAPLPPPVKALTPAQVRSIRRKLNVSQPIFAALLNIPTVTVASWERGRRKPTGAALRVLDLARRYPEILMAR